jgi:hypothetical protein
MLYPLSYEGSSRQGTKARSDAHRSLGRLGPLSRARAS